MKKFSEWASKLNEDMNPEFRDMNFRNRENDSTRGVNDSEEDDISTSRMRYDLDKVSRASDDKGSFATTYPNLNREMTKLSPEARVELHNIIQVIMQQSISWGKTVSNKFK